MTFEPFTADSASADHPRDALPAARFTLERAPFAGQSFAVRFRVWPNPCCPRGVVGFVCQPQTAPDPAAPPIQPPPPLCFDLDVCRGDVNTAVQSAPEGVALGRAFLTEAQDEQRAWLHGFSGLCHRRVRTGGVVTRHSRRSDAGASLGHREPRPGRNDPCPCGSGKKFKKCCGAI